MKPIQEMTTAEIESEILRMSPAARPVEELSDEELMAEIQAASGRGAPTLGEEGGVLEGLMAPVKAVGQAIAHPIDTAKAIGEQIMGTERATRETQNLPEWTTMPELNQMSVASFKTALGSLLSNPKETVQILQANFPGVQVRQDEKGNYLLQSSVDGMEYAIPPGFSVGDIPRALSGVAAFTPAGRAASIAGAGLAAGGTQAAIEASQAATGGEFNPAEVASSASGGAMIPAAVQGARRIAQAVRPAAPAAPAASEAFSQAASTASRAAREVPPPTPPPAAPVAHGRATGAAANIAEAAGIEAAEEVGTLARKAAGGNVAAKEKLAGLAKVNPEAMQAAERLGLELPFDVFSDNPQVRAAVGLTRSAVGSEAEAAWKQSVGNAIQKADDVIKQFDVSFTEGAVSPAAVSDKVRDSLTKTRSALNSEATKVYEAVDAAVPKNTPVELQKTLGVLDSIIGEVGEQGLSAPERRLRSMLISRVEGAPPPEVTYGRLIREKNLIGQAMRGAQSPYGNMEAGALKRLYAALAEDQLENVGRIGGEELRSQLRGANLIYAKERALGDRIVNLFGKDLEGSIARKMRSAITNASKGDAADFNRLLKVVPKDLQREVVATAIADVARTKNGGFGFSEYANLYPKLRANAPVYKQVVDTLGPESNQVLRDLFELSKRITDARGNVITTGKANQAIANAMQAEGLAARVLQSLPGRAITTGVGAAAAGPIGAATTSMLSNALAAGNKDAIRAAGKLFTSPEFQKLAIEAATKAPAKQTLLQAARSKAMDGFMRAIRKKMTPEERIQWLTSAMQTGKTLTGGGGGNDEESQK